MMNLYATSALLLQDLESILPPRAEVDIPTGENVEEVDLVEFDSSHASGSRRGREAYDEDDSDDEPGMRRVQCAHQ